MTDFILERSVWFTSTDGKDCLAHIMARNLINRPKNNSGYENLLQIIRRYE